MLMRDGGGAFTAYESPMIPCKLQNNHNQEPMLLGASDPYLYHQRQLSSLKKQRTAIDNEIQDHSNGE